MYVVVNVWTVILVLIFLLIFYLKWKLTFWQRRGVQTLPTVFPFGNMKNIVLQRASIGEDFKNFYDGLKARKVRYGGYYFFCKPIFVPIDLDLIKDILIKDFAHFPNHNHHFDPVNDPLSAHLFSMKGQEWKNMRYKLSPTFTSGKIKMMFESILKESDNLLIAIDRKVLQENFIEIKDLSSRYTMDVVGSAVFGFECKSLQYRNSEFRTLCLRFFSGGFRETIIRIFSSLLPELLVALKIPSTPPDVSKYFKGLFESTIKYREENNVIRKDFLHLLIQLKNKVDISEDEVGNLKDSVKDSQGLTMAQLLPQAFVFFQAGFETTANTMASCFYELSQNRDCQQKLRDELDEVLRRHDGKITYDSLQEMIYMEKCIFETLRKYPSVPIHTRECVKEYKVANSNVVIHPGEQIFISPMGIQMDGDIWPDPERFLPERFDQENVIERHPMAWLPFGEGPRLCIGRRFAMVSLKVALASVMRNFSFKLHPDTIVPLKSDPSSIVLAPKGKVLLIPKRISNILVTSGI